MPEHQEETKATKLVSYATIERRGRRDIQARRRDSEASKIFRRATVSLIKMEKLTAHTRTLKKGEFVILSVEGRGVVLRARDRRCRVVVTRNQAGDLCVCICSPKSHGKKKRQ